jgi:hypothetical protein
VLLPIDHSGHAVGTEVARLRSSPCITNASDIGPSAGNGTHGHSATREYPLGNRERERSNQRCTTGAVGQAGLFEVPHVTRSPTVTGPALATGIMQCHAWAELAQHSRSGRRDSAWRSVRHG